VNDDLTHLPYVERKIREAIARGEFDDLPGSGDPIPDLDDDPMWWVKKWVERERLKDALREGRTRGNADPAPGP
jgi:hypothetical protein